MKRFRLLLRGAVMLIITGMVASCNNEFDKILPVDNTSDSTNSVAKTRKVLYIIADGARGWSVRDAKPPVMTALTKTATYSWYSLSDEQGNDGNGWADLLTGVSSSKHLVTDDSFSGNNLAEYPVVFQRIKEVKPQLRLASFASSSVFKDNLTAGTDVSQSFSTDAEVKDAVIAELGNQDATLVLGQFNNIDAAGQQYGYDNSFPEYKNAILQFDQYVGEMIAAVKARKTYATEDWLIVITSNHGGEATLDPSVNDNTIFSKPTANTFTIIYNAAYSPYLISKPFTGNKYLGTFVRLYSAEKNSSAKAERSVRAVVENNNEVYNFKDTISFTVELKVKVMPGGNNNYIYTWPSILAKRAAFSGGTPGWCVFLEQKYWMVNFGQVGQGNTQTKGADISDGTWHSIGFVVLNRDFKRYVRTYTDGKFNSEVDITGKGNINSPAPLTMGFLPGSVNVSPDVYMGDVRIWKAALPDETIAQYACDTRISSSHPYFSRLIGYWPGDDGDGLVIEDESPAENDFHIGVGEGCTLQWNSLNDIVCPPPTSNLALLVPTTRDLPRQVLTWLTVSPPENWGLEGQVWINK